MKVIVDTEKLGKALHGMLSAERAAYYSRSFRDIHEGTIDVPWAEKYHPPQFGTEPRKMARKENIETSHAAAKSLDTTKYEEEVYLQIITYGKEGCTALQLVRDMGRAECSISPRIAPLIRKGFIFDTGKRRKETTGRQQRVVVAKEFYEPTERNEDDV